MHKRAPHKQNYLPHRSTMDTEKMLLSLAQKHFGQQAHWGTPLWEFLHDVSTTLHKNIHHQVRQSQQATEMRGDGKHDAFRTIRNLQNLVVRLRRDANGTIVYTMREGRLAGEHTTDLVLNKPIDEFLDNAALQDVIAHAERAFRGECVQFEYEIGGRTYLRFFSPIADELTNEITEVVGSLTDITVQKETERQLRSSDRLFRKLIDSIPIGILKQETHGDGKVHNEVANAEFQRISGYSIDELWNMSAEDRLQRIHPDDRDEVIRRWSDWLTRKDDGTLNVTYRFLHRSGEYRTFQNYMVKFFSEEGNLVCVQAVLDVTSSTANEKQLRHLASYLEQSIIPIFEINHGGEICFMNAAAGTTFADLMTTGAQHPVLLAFDEVIQQIEQQRDRVVKRIVTVGSDYYEQIVHFMPEANVYRVFCHNITTMKHAEEELRESLEKERALSLLRSSFIDTISHEFRTPLTGINTSAELLQRYDSAMTHDERLMHVEAIRSRVQDIVNLVSRFTTQSSLRTLRDTFTPAALDIISMLRKILEEIRSYVTDKKQFLRYDLPSHPLIISGDERLLRHAIRNILLNAVQYSAEGATMRVQLRFDATSIQICVTDEGVGIPDREIELMFTPYYRGSNVSTLPGIGLGMSIAKEFVELHKGSVQVRSQVGKGTIVTVDLPLLAVESGMDDPFRNDAKDA